MGSPQISLALNAPSVYLPESVTPSASLSADADDFFPDSFSDAVLLPERFRGGCSFGAD